MRTKLPKSSAWPTACGTKSCGSVRSARAGRSASPPLASPAFLAVRPMLFILSTILSTVALGTSTRSVDSASALSRIAVSPARRQSPFESVSLAECASLRWSMHTERKKVLPQPLGPSSSIDAPSPAELSIRWNCTALSTKPS
eukprot:6430553-Prymnesium_polylepis.1